MDHTRLTYDIAAERMAEKFRAMGPRTADIEKIFSFVRKENASILEIGCGDGRDASEFVKRTSQYVGIDYSEGMLRLAREYVPGADFRLANVSEFEFPNDLDAIVAFASLLHLPPENIRNIVRKGYEALNAGGVFCISLKAGNGSETKTDEFGTRTYYYYEPEDILSFIPYEIPHETETSEVR